MNDFEDTKNLIRLKRYERPPEGYFDGFLEEFRERQRAELMRSSSRSLFFERLNTYFSDFISSRMVFAGGAAAAVVLAIVVTRPRPTEIDSTAGLPPDFDAPQGTVTPVSAPDLTPDVELLEKRANGAQGEARQPTFRVEPLPGANAETQIFEL